MSDWIFGESNKRKQLEWREACLHAGVTFMAAAGDSLLSGLAAVTARCPVTRKRPIMSRCRLTRLGSNWLSISVKQTLSRH